MSCVHLISVTFAQCRGQENIFVCLCCVCYSQQIVSRSVLHGAFPFCPLLLFLLFHLLISFFRKRVRMRTRHDIKTRTRLIRAITRLEGRWKVENNGGNDRVCSIQMTDHTTGRRVIHHRVES